MSHLFNECSLCFLLRIVCEEVFTLYKLNYVALIITWFKILLDDVQHYLNCQWLSPHAAVKLCAGSTGESIDSIKDYEEDFFQNSRLLRQVTPDSPNFNVKSH